MPITKESIQEIIKDLKAYLGDDFHVISRDSLQALVEYKKIIYKANNKPFNCQIININDFGSTLKNLLKERPGNTHPYFRMQVIIENGDGTLPDSGVHYSAVDIQINTDGTFYCGSMDSTLMNNTEIQKAVKETSGFLKLYQCYGGKIQNDAWSCPFYALTLAIALHESEIDYNSYSSSNVSDVVDVPWGQLKPMFIWNIQSWQFIEKYIDFYSDNSGKESKFLMQQFGLSRQSFFTHLSRTLVPNKEGKIINKGIRMDGEEMVSELIHYLTGLENDFQLDGQNIFLTN